MREVRLYGIGSSFEYTLRRAANRIGIGRGQPYGDLNRQLRGYPSNHNYGLCRGRILPSRQLLARLRKVVRLYADGMDTFLDIACCRGAYVLEAARRPGCRLAVGIDVWEPFIRVAESVRAALAIERARFVPGAIEEVADDLGRCGGPFHTVLLLGAYHYLFWGMEGRPKGLMSHAAIFELLDRLCSHQLILSGRLEIDRCPPFIRKRAASSDRRADYDTPHFLQQASRLFTVREVGHLGSSPLFLMPRR